MSAVRAAARQATDSSGRSAAERLVLRDAAALLLDGVPAGDVIARLQAAGADRHLAIAACDEVLADPVFEAGLAVAQRLGKLDSMLSARQAMRELTDYGSEIERRSGVGPDESLDVYYSGNLPVILTDVCRDWPARKRWTSGYLRDVLRGVEVEVTAGRSADPRYEVNSDQHRTLMRFDDYASLIEAEPGNDRYIVANNRLLEIPAAAPLWEDFSIDRRYLDPAAPKETTFLWYGPAGTVTPLHHDIVNVLLTQVRGRKRVRLISPLDSHCVYNEIGVYSEVDAAEPDLDRFPRFARTRCFDVELAAGEALFIPVGWWHHVESLTPSASVSFTGFLFPNGFEWVHPGG